MPNRENPTFEERKDAVFKWVDAVVGKDIEVIFLRPNEQRPSKRGGRKQFPGEYVTLQFTSPGTKVGGEDIVHKSGDVFTATSQHMATLSIIAYGENATTIAEKIQRSLSKPTVLLGLRTDGLAVWNEPSLTDISALLETGFETRTNLDVILGFIATDDDTIGIVEKVLTEGDMTGNTKQITVNDTIEVP